MSPPSALRNTLGPPSKLRPGSAPGEPGAACHDGGGLVGAVAAHDQAPPTAPLWAGRAAVFSPAGSSCGEPRRKRPVVMQQRLKAAGGPAGAEVVPPEFLDELDVAAQDAVAALDPGLATGTPGGACSSAQKVPSGCFRLTM